MLNKVLEKQSSLEFLGRFTLSTLMKLSDSVALDLRLH